MGLMTIDVRCEFCDEVSIITVDREKRNDMHHCPVCDHEARRIWSVPNVTKASYVDGTKRFAGIKERQKLKKDKAAAQARGDFGSESKINNEIKKVKD